MKINRLAVSTFFFSNGFLYANWAARLPEIQQHYGISSAELGTLLLASAAGAILSMPFVGLLTMRFGTAKLTRTMGILFCLAMPFIPIFPNVWLLGGFFFLLGLSNGSLDVAMNGQAVFVERLFGKPIMSSFHAVFSVGMALGAGVGALFAKFGISLLTHFVCVSAVTLLGILWAAFHLVNDAPFPTNRDFSDASTVFETKSVEKMLFRLPTKAILPLGIIAFCGMTGEGSMVDWSAIYMHKVVGRSEAFSALAFGAFAASMTIGRVFGDYLWAKFGRRKLLISNSLLAIFGLTLTLVFVSEGTTLVGFGLVGLGLATVVPIVYSTAGNTEGVAPSVGISMATTVGYSGFFVGPPVIGYLADAFGLRVGLIFALVLFVVMLVLVRRLKMLN